MISQCHSLRCIFDNQVPESYLPSLDCVHIQNSIDIRITLQCHKHNPWTIVLSMRDSRDC